MKTIACALMLALMPAAAAAIERPDWDPTARDGRRAAQAGDR